MSYVAEYKSNYVKSLIFNGMLFYVNLNTPDYQTYDFNLHSNVYCKASPILN